MERKWLRAILLGLVTCASPSWAEEWRPSKILYPYLVHSNGDRPDQNIQTIIGRERRHAVGKDDTLLDLARSHYLGYEELVQANPGVDPWVPAVGLKVKIPSVWILPDASYRGLVLNIPEMRLYYYLSDSRVMTFPIGIGMEGWDTPAGKYWIGEKRVNPVWYVPASIQKEMEEPRKVVPPGPDNPLGSHWMRLSNTSFGIHGTNNPWAVGRYVTHGCIRLYPEDIAYLFPRLAPKTPVEVIYQYAKLGMRDGKAYFQVYRYNRMRDGELFLHLIRQSRKLELIVDPHKLLDKVKKARDGELVSLPVD